MNTNLFSLAFMWQVMLETSLVHMKEGLGTRVISRPVFLLSQFLPRPPPPVFVTCSMWRKWWVNSPSQILQKHLGAIVSFPTIATHSISQCRNNVGGKPLGTRLYASKASDQKTEAGTAPGTKASKLSKCCTFLLIKMVWTETCMTWYHEV